MRVNLTGHCMSQQKSNFVKSDGITKFYNYDSSNDVIIVNDIDIQVNTREKFQHYGASFDVGGSSFHIAIKESKNSMKFAIENERHVTSDVEGLLGFTMAKSYEVFFFILVPHTVFNPAYHIRDCIRVVGKSS